MQIVVSLTVVTSSQPTFTGYNCTTLTNTLCSCEVTVPRSSAYTRWKAEVRFWSVCCTSHFSSFLDSVQLQLLTVNTQQEQADFHWEWERQGVKRHEGAYLK